MCPVPCIHIVADAVCRLNPQDVSAEIAERAPYVLVERMRRPRSGIQLDAGHLLKQLATADASPEVAGGLNPGPIQHLTLVPCSAISANPLSQTLSHKTVSGSTATSARPSPQAAPTLHALPMLQRDLILASRLLATSDHRLGKTELAGTTLVSRPRRHLTARSFSGVHLRRRPTAPCHPPGS